MSREKNKSSLEESRHLGGQGLVIGPAMPLYMGWAYAGPGENLLPPAGVVMGVLPVGGAWSSLPVPGN